MTEEPKETKEEPCKHTAIKWTFFSNSSDPVIECALCGKEWPHEWDNVWNVEITLEE